MKIKSPDCHGYERVFIHGKRFCKKGKKWYGRFYIEDESGRKIQKEFAGTESKAETEAILRKAMEDYEEKKFVAKSENATVGSLLDMWVEKELKPGQPYQAAPYRQSKAENHHRRSFTGVYGLPQLRRDKSRRHNRKSTQQRVFAFILGSSARSFPLCGIPQKADFL